jgi:predicted DNA binding CopG/RHH family protein
MKFVSKAQEAAWWEANEQAIGERFEKTLAEGYSGQCNLVVTGDSTITKIRLGSRALLKLKRQATELSLTHQTYLKMIIREALLNAESSRKTATS